MEQRKAKQTVIMWAKKMCFAFSNRKSESLQKKSVYFGLSVLMQTQITRVRRVSGDSFYPHVLLPHPVG